MMLKKQRLSRLLAGALVSCLICSPLLAAETTASSAAPAQAPSATATHLEPRAINILKAMGARLKAASSMSFIATITYEKPSRLGPPLAYGSISEVSLQRPNRLRVLTLGDGPATEFYYDGQRVFAYAPAENLLAVADAPPTIDATLEAVYQRAAIYFPFTDVIVADPYADLARDMRLAFYIGQSKTVGGTTTDVIAYANDDVFVQAWIGTQDKLPRMLRAVFRDDPTQARHQVAFSNWKLNSAMPASFFKPAAADTAKRIEFAAPRPPAKPESTAQQPTKQP